MNDFRKITPKRRSNPAVRNEYRKYKPELREDFHQRCGYCGDHDFFSVTYYEVDHFVPKNLDKTKEKDYTNLVYSCRSCNNSKRDKWPTNNSQKPNDGREGWIDPCDPQYSQQFVRLRDGSIKATTVLGSWIWSALGLGKPNHRVIWKLEELKCIFKKIDQMTSENADLDELKMINKLNIKYRKLEESLRGVPDFD